MSFWSGEKLAEQLPNGLIVPYDVKKLDCASYRLCVGGEAFVTSDKFGASAPGDPLITILGDSPNHTLRIRPGQFAFLLTDEKVTVPDDAIALISMRAKYKFQGLINVSGFHVDPGWSGKLLFSVYNAGANEVIVSKGEELFLIVYSGLDRKSKETYKGSSQDQKAIKPDLIKDMTGQVFSPLMLQRKVEDLSDSAKTLKAVTYTVTTGVAILLAAVAILVTVVPSFTGVLLVKTIESAGYEIKQKDNGSAVNKDAALVTEPLKMLDPVKPPLVSASKPK
jgi:dCTP deaminase